ncbi:G0/G1 switch protein 2 isoform X1 [Poecilia formosa]|uniref:G0/G1 switch protein 2 isoform X1 n=2 Tax=Poecilia formosa TaxID=48698 RepID=UPI0007B9D41E|nr:PREDICTED: G0/G1 switch protein 2 isoform X1 [Poecilia formosa]
MTVVPHEYASGLRELTWLFSALNCRIFSCLSTIKIEPNTLGQSRLWYVLQAGSSNPNMESISDIIPFAKDLLSLKPTRSMLKIYMLGSTLAVLGMVGGMVEMIFLPFAEDRTIEEELEQLLIENKKKKDVPTADTTSVPTEDVMAVVMSEAKVKHPGSALQRSSANRLYAS